MIRSDWAWAAWAFGGLASFAVVQSFAFGAYPDYRHTLSATTRRWLGVYPVRPRRAASAAGATGALAVFLAHVLAQPAPHQQYPDPDPRFA